jgi:transcription initiation factor TFIIIB Brf1 subunit/transcription initiation factor TFIIB
MDLEEIWKELDNENLKMKSKIVNTSSEIFVCRNCESDNLNRDGQIICQDCGLVLDDCRIVSKSSYDNYDNTNTQEFKSNKYPNSNKMLKMQEWYMWTNEEKNIYKLKTYIQNLCLQLHIIENLVNYIVETTVLVMNCIKKNDGTKRARVKDGIIIMCIHYVTKDTDTPYSYVDLSKQLNLDMKYVTKAERIILELINSKKLKLDKMLVLKTQNPFHYVTTIINKNNMKISKEILNKVQILILLCEDNDLLLDHTPLSVGVSCFYYILKLENMDIDLKKFSELYNLSVVTVVKTYNKLKIYNDKINKYLASVNYSNL